MFVIRLRQTFSFSFYVGSTVKGVTILKKYVTNNLESIRFGHCPCTIPFSTNDRLSYRVHFYFVSKLTPTERILNVLVDWCPFADIMRSLLRVYFLRQFFSPSFWFAPILVRRYINVRRTFVKPLVSLVVSLAVDKNFKLTCHTYSLIAAT